jgi:hypothetical protein
MAMLGVRATSSSTIAMWRWMASRSTLPPVTSGPSVIKLLWSPSSSSSWSRPGSAARRTLSTQQHQRGGSQDSANDITMRRDDSKANINPNINNEHTTAYSSPYGTLGEANDASSTTPTTAPTIPKPSKRTKATPISDDELVGVLKDIRDKYVLPSSQPDDARLVDTKISSMSSPIQLPVSSFLAKDDYIKLLRRCHSLSQTLTVLRSMCEVSFDS